MKQLISLLALSSSLTACAVEDDPVAAEEVGVGEASQAFTGLSNYSWGDTQTSSADIGTSVNRTCFLTGLGGSMRPIGAYPFSNGQFPAMAGVRKKANGNYEIYVQPESGHHLIAFARCVNTAAGRIELKHTSGDQDHSGDKVIGASTGGRQCFLQDVINFAAPIVSGGQTIGWGWGFEDGNNLDEVRVLDDGDFWKVQINKGTHSFPVNIHADVVCINASHFDGGVSLGAAANETTHFDLTSKAGATCGLAGVRGGFDAAFGDWDDSINLSQSGAQFTLNVSNRKRAWARCMD